MAPNVSAETVATPITFPTGTVTFLFTDIEGSTRLAETLGQAWPPLLERHRQIVRAALAANGGLEVQTEGDGFFAVFTTAPAAIAAAVRAQRDLVAEPWPSDVSVRVRMGIHSGSGEVDRDGLYVGHDVHRASRVADAAHGGQVLISDTTRALTGSALPDGVSLRDMGEHRLKDLRPQPLAQLVIDDLPADFPPVRSLDARPNNLPVQLTSFVGRDRELQTVARLLAATRLLTLTGPGGTGKTRLALQLAALVADDHRDGVWFVPLEPLRDPELVLPTVARTMGIFPGPGQSPSTRWPSRSASGRCCCSWTTSSRWSRLPEAWPVCSAPARACGSSSPAGPSCGWRESRSTSWPACRHRLTRGSCLASSSRSCRPRCATPMPPSSISTRPFGSSWHGRWRCSRVSR